MSSDRTDHDTLANGRNWAALPADGAPIEWTVDPEQGCIQGPLDLGFLRGRRLALILQEDQQALLVADGQLRAVFLDGAHFLAVGNGHGQVSPDSRLIFLAMNAPLHLSWPRANPLRWGDGPRQALIGSCALRVEWPVRFFETFLLGHANPDSDFVRRLIDQMVRGLFAELLAVTAADDDAAGSAVQARLMGLTPGDLNDDLAPCGLTCTHLAVYTAAPPVGDVLAADTDVTVVTR